MHRLPFHKWHDRWEFEKGRKALTVSPQGPVSFDDPDLVIQAVLDGVGIGTSMEGNLAVLLNRKRLVQVLQDWCPSFPGYFLYYLTRRNQPAALAAQSKHFAFQTNQPVTGNGKWPVLGLRQIANARFQLALVWVRALACSQQLRPRAVRLVNTSRYTATKAAGRCPACWTIHDLKSSDTPCPQEARMRGQTRGPEA